MRLSEKGRFEERPALEGPAEKVAAAVEAWDGVHARTHWELGDERIVDGADFYVGESELGHIHLYREAHIAVPKAVGAALIESGFAEPFEWSRAFVVKSIDSARDAREAEWIFTLAYDRLRGAAIEALVERIRARAR